MGQELNLLNEIRQNAEMGRDGVMHVIKLTYDSNFRSALERQLTEYQEIFNSADTILRSNGREPMSANPIAKMSSYVTSTFKSMMNSSTSNLAEMMIQGSTMGVTKISKGINEYSGANQKVLGLARKLLKTEERNIEEMKKFL